MDHEKWTSTELLTMLKYKRVPNLSQYPTKQARLKNTTHAKMTDRQCGHYFFVSKYPVNSSHQKLQLAKFFFPRKLLKKLRKLRKLCASPDCSASFANFEQFAQNLQLGG